MCSDILSIHRKNQVVCGECIKLLESLLPYFSSAESNLDEEKKSYISLVSGFWYICSVCKPRLHLLYNMGYLVLQ